VSAADEAARIVVGRAESVRQAAAAVRGFLEFQELMSGGQLPVPAGLAEETGIALAYEALRCQTLECTGCELATRRTRAVFSSGNPLSRVVLVGEAPGAEEDAVGEPFVGEAGKLLDKILTAMSLTRRDVCIINVIKCRPPGNRDPLPQEIEACSCILERQLALLQPMIICALGRVAAQTLLKTSAPLGALRGTWHRRGSARLIATYHPAALLRNESLKKVAWEDFKKLRRQHVRMIT
jgi:uracil-DNA glycosylase family 4